MDIPPLRQGRGVFMNTPFFSRDPQAEPGAVQGAEQP